MIQDFICNSMGYDLENKFNNSFTCSNWWFQRILELAKKAGWNPIGTSLQNNDTWDKQDYETQSGQLVSKEDSVELFRVLSNLLAVHKSIAGTPIALMKDEIEMVSVFLKFIKPEGTRNACSFFIR